MKIEYKVIFDTYFAINIHLFGACQYWNVAACQKILQLEKINQ